MENRKLNRLKGFDYSAAGYYFVTICVQDRMCCLGEVINGEMVLNEYGKIVERQWEWLKENFEYVNLDIFQVMPDHFHGIIVICPVGNGRDHSIIKIKPISELVGAFKTTSSKAIHGLGLTEFSWQKSFYDHIIRDEESLNRIRKYISENPSKWQLGMDEPDDIFDDVPR